MILDLTRFLKTRSDLPRLPPSLVELRRTSRQGYAGRGRRAVFVVIPRCAIAHRGMTEEQSNAAGWLARRKRAFAHPTRALKSLCFCAQRAHHFKMTSRTGYWISVW